MVTKLKQDSKLSKNQPVVLCVSPRPHQLLVPLEVRSEASVAGGTTHPSD